MRAQRASSIAPLAASTFVRHPVRDRYLGECDTAQCQVRRNVNKAVRYQNDWCMSHRPKQIRSTDNGLRRKNELLKEALTAPAGRASCAWRPVGRVVERANTRQIDFDQLRPAFRMFPQPCLANFELYPGGTEALKRGEREEQQPQIPSHDIDGFAPRGTDKRPERITGFECVIVAKKRIQVSANRLKLAPTDAAAGLHG